jgi:large subunit ribosomal protein L9
MALQVVLNTDVKKIGYRGDVVKVKAGFYRNFLAPKGLADLATKTRLSVANSRKEKMVMKKQQVLENVKEVIAKLQGLKVVIKGKITKTGKLYGAIGEDKVAAAIKDACKVEIGKESIKMEHIKTVGEHNVVVSFGEGVEASVTVAVEPL